MSAVASSNGNLGGGSGEADATVVSEPHNEAPTPVQDETAIAPDETPRNDDDIKRRMLLKSSSCPGPGDYMWKDDVHLRRKPLFSIGSPDRKNLDLCLGTWTAASSSLQPRAPAPDAYSVFGLGKNGKFKNQVAIWKPTHDVPQKPEPLGLKLELPTECYGTHPAKRMNPRWSMFGAERKYLAADRPSWTPKPPTDRKPGPGAYDLDRTSRWKAFSRKGSFGGRQLNLHPDEMAWVPKTRGSMMVGGEAARLRPPMAMPKDKPMFVPDLLRRQ